MKKDNKINDELKKLAAMSDDEIDMSDIPEISEQKWRERGEVGKFYRPINKQDRK